jgi:HK97 family phage portal protein
VYAVDGNGLPAEVHCLDPGIVAVVPTSTDALTPNAEYRVRGVTYRGNMLHLKGVIRPGELKGISPVENARQSIGLGLAAQEFAARFYANGASLSGVIETPQDMTFDQARDTVRKFAGDHAGLRNAHRPGLLDNGAVWKPLSVTPEQAQFLESRQFQTAEIASQMFLLDPAWFSMVPAGGSSLTYQNIESRGSHLAQYTLARWIIRIEKAVTELLPSPQSAKFNLDALKRGDLAARAGYYTAALDPIKGWMVKDEIRELEDLGPMPKVPVPPVPQLVPMPAAVPAPAAANGS